MLIEKTRIPFKAILLQGFLPPFMKKFLYYLKGYKIGKNVKIGFGAVIIGNDIDIGDYSKIGFFTAIIADSIEIEQNASIGSFTYINCVKFKIGEDSKIREQVNIGGTLNQDSILSIGKRCSIGQSCYINPSRSITIGDDTAIGGNSLIFTHGSWQSVIDGYSVKYEPVTIEKNVYIGWRVFIMPGITIGENSTIAGGSTITINVPPNSLGSGSPLKIAISGKDKWPRTLSFTTRVKLIEDINDKFNDYLNYHGFHSVIIRNDTHDKIEIGNGNAIYFYKISLPKIELMNNNTYMFIEGFSIKKSKNILILDIKKRSRSGSNKLGEEYISYLSRYGIRFERT